MHACGVRSDGRVTPCLECIVQERDRYRAEVEHRNLMLQRAEQLYNAVKEERDKVQMDAIAANLRVRECRRVLEAVKEQGLSHQCATEGYISRGGCDDCKANTEAEIDRVLELTEKRIESHPNLPCGDGAGECSEKQVRSGPKCPTCGTEERYYGEETLCPKCNGMCG